MTAVLTVVVLNALFSVDVWIAKSLHPNAEAGEPQWREVFDATFSSRTTIWKTSLRYLAEHKRTFIKGMGLGSPLHKVRSTYPEAGILNNTFHNSLLGALMHGGIGLLGCVLAMLVMLVKPCLDAVTQPDRKDDPGAYLLAIMVGMLLVVSIMEENLIAASNLSNIAFYYAAGRVMHRYGRLKELGGRKR